MIHSWCFMLFLNPPGHSAKTKGSQCPRPCPGETHWRLMDLWIYGFMDVNWCQLISIQLMSIDVNAMQILSIECSLPQVVTAADLVGWRFQSPSLLQRSLEIYVMQPWCTALPLVFVKHTTSVASTCCQDTFRSLALRSHNPDDSPKWANKTQLVSKILRLKVPEMELSCHLLFWFKTGWEFESKTTAGKCHSFSF